MNSELGGALFENTPLFTAQNRLFLLHDRERIREQVGKVFKPHDLKVATSTQEVSASMHHVHLGKLSLSRLEYGVPVSIDPGRLENFFLIQIPTRGSAEIHCDGVRFTSSAQCASIISPDTPVSMRWAADAPQLALRLERQEVEKHCAQHLGHGLKTPLRFKPELLLTHPNASYFLQLLGALADALACDGHPIHNPLVLKQFEATLINALIYGQPNTLQNPLSAPEPARRVSPYFVKRTEEFILAHAHEPLSIEQLAEHAGGSVRTLFSGFREFRNISPMAFLRNVRMERVHLELRNPGTDSVTDIAMKWGFAHLGRFSQEYRKYYGELPSATLRFRQ
ncbi:BenABC operon transcriptional activator BenR [Pseudomonas amygdali pv. ulmi]|uniref:BenABC operon transcriptional activator BenR n=1 Tax=Pseudomonas amygdali pv. ulmi TaxID=251720 RepID=A0A0Q0EGK2_PSEA0|nr:AraC family transcriptional regulator [Pseudomonas amygdali]KPZ13074.1 BenABC operon transcriptional activator BenR [Pseudomonas amygdali pv. ulmi]KWS30226.1 AraC family transcriptional regulator [Pseudomonas amygdali pv. ulmi]RMR21042.1 BenABC operon transcriptional activator BenR [Pseudomonas amygdali pv. ulmi]